MDVFSHVFNSNCDKRLHILPLGFHGLHPPPTRFHAESLEALQPSAMRRQDLHSAITRARQSILRRSEKAPSCSGRPLLCRSCNSLKASNLPGSSLRSGALCHSCLACWRKACPRHPCKQRGTVPRPLSEWDNGSAKRRTSQQSL